jgi:Protein of unknown function (DUF2849)
MTSPLEQKLKITGPVVVTANRLPDGAVIYRTADRDWTTRLTEAAVVNTAPAARELLVAAVADDVGAVGAYVAPVLLERDGTILPGNLRERIRNAGPTIELPGQFGRDQFQRSAPLHEPRANRRAEAAVDLPGAVGL